MKLGSLCSGYGGLDLAAEAFFDAETVWHSETNPDCSQVLAARFPGIPNIGDLTTADWTQAEPVDVLCAGFPCQPVSAAGRRKGKADERWLWENVRDSIGVLRPRYVVLENVTGILTLGSVGIIGTLTSMGYDSQWGVVRASDAGAPHRRARWFCIATDVADATHLGYQRGGRSRRRRVGSPNGNTTTADTSGTEWRTPEYEAVGATARRTTKPGECDRPSATNADSPRLQGHWRSQEVGTRRRLVASESDSTSCDWDRYTGAIRRWELILGRPAPIPVTDSKLCPVFVEWMMGLPGGWVTDIGLTRTAALKMLGNGVCPQQAALALTILGPRIGSE